MSSLWLPLDVGTWSFHGWRLVEENESYWGKLYNSPERILFFFTNVFDYLWIYAEHNSSMMIYCIGEIEKLDQLSVILFMNYGYGHLKTELSNPVYC